MNNLTEQPTPADTAARNYVLYNGLKFATEDAEQQVLAAHAFGYMRGQEECHAAPGWQSFSAAKPMHNSVVLFCREYDQAVVVGIFLAFDEWNRPNMCIVGGGFNPMHRFSYWMPLPQPPENPTTVSF